MMIEFGETNHVAAAATAVAVKQTLAGVHQKTWLVIVVQRAQPHPPATAELPCRPPILRLQIVQKGNLPFQFIEHFAAHVRLTSTVRLRQTAPRSQATLVVVPTKCPTAPPAVLQPH